MSESDYVLNLNYEASSDEELDEAPFISKDDLWMWFKICILLISYQVTINEYFILENITIIRKSFTPHN